MKHPITHNTYEIHQHQAGSKKTTQPSNPLNLPTSINFYSKDQKIDYIYTASGQKTEQKTIDGGRVENRRQYAGSFVFKNRRLSYAASIAGRFLYLDLGRGNYDFENEIALKDHLGNTRVTLDEHGNSTQQIDYYPFGHMIYASDTQTPFAEDNRYLYNGKELQDDFGLEWYDYGARFYDGQIARFHSVDLLGEVYSFQSPFAYAANNPIYYVDYMGLGPKEWWESIRGWFRDKILNQTPTAGLQRVKPAREEREVILDKQYNFFPPLTLSSDNRWGNEVAHNSTFDHSYKSYVKQQGATIHGQSPFSWGVSDDVYSTTIFQDRIFGNKKRMLIQIDNPDIAMVSSRIRRFLGINLKNRIYIRANGRYRQFPGVYQYTPDELDFMRKNNIPIEENPQTHASASFSPYYKITLVMIGTEAFFDELRSAGIIE